MTYNDIQEYMPVRIKAGTTASYPNNHMKKYLGCTGYVVKKGSEKVRLRFDDPGMQQLQDGWWWHPHDLERVDGGEHV
jgi:hypothetical protein